MRFLENRKYTLCVDVNGSQMNLAHKVHKVVGYNYLKDIL